MNRILILKVLLQSKYFLAKAFIAFLFLVLPIAAFSQSNNDYIIYLDSLGRRTEAGNHDYIRLLQNFRSKVPHCKVYEFYKSGKRKMVGLYSDKYFRFKTGPFTTYYENGNMQSQISYFENIPSGKCYFWYENGSKKAECEFVRQKSDDFPIMKVNQYWSRIAIQRIIDGKGRFQDEDMTSFSEGELKDGVKDGEWWGTDYKDFFTFTENYAKGKLVSGTSIDSLNQKHSYEAIYVLPKPINDIKHFLKYVKKELKYRKDLKNNEYSEKIAISFTVSSTGKLSDFDVFKYEQSNIDEALIEICKNYGDWRPAKSRGINTESFLTIPIDTYRY